MLHLLLPLLLQNCERIWLSRTCELLLSRLWMPRLLMCMWLSRLSWMPRLHHWLLLHRLLLHHGLLLLLRRQRRTGSRFGQYSPRPTSRVLRKPQHMCDRGAPRVEVAGVVLRLEFSGVLRLEVSGVLVRPLGVVAGRLLGVVADRLEGPRERPPPHHQTVRTIYAKKSVQSAGTESLVSHH